MSCAGATRLLEAGAEMAREALSAQCRGVVPEGGLVPANFLVADVAGRIVGRTSVRDGFSYFPAHE